MCGKNHNGYQFVLAIKLKILIFRHFVIISVIGEFRLQTKFLRLSLHALMTSK